MANPTNEQPAKQKLINFLERRAWNPVLKASPVNYPEAEQKILGRVKRKTESQRERYQGYRSAGEVRQEFEDDLTSQPAKKVHADLRRLNLPTQPDVKVEFLHLADRLGITRGERERRHKPHPPQKTLEAGPRQKSARKKAA